MGYVHLSVCASELRSQKLLIVQIWNFSGGLGILLFKTYCSNMYCSHLWSNYKASVFRKLKTSFNKVFRILFNLDRRASISQAMLERKIHAFDIIVRSYIFGFKARLENCDNILIKTLLNCFYYSTSQLYLLWSKKLYTLWYNDILECVLCIYVYICSSIIWIYSEINVSYLILSYLILSYLD